MRIYLSLFIYDISAERVHYTDRDTEALRDENLGKLPTAAQQGSMGKLRNICLFIGTWLDSIICSSGGENRGEEQQDNLLKVSQLMSWTISR